MTIEDKRAYWRRKTLKWNKNHPERQKEIQKRSYRKHREEIIARKLVCYLQHKDKYIARAKAWRLAHPEQVREQAKRFYLRHAEKIRVQRAEWRKSNPEKAHQLDRKSNQLRVGYHREYMRAWRAKQKEVKI